MAIKSTTTENPTAPALVEENGGNVLIERCAATFSVVEEATEPGKPKKVKVRGEFAKCDEATANKRVYPKTLWEREIKRLSEAFGERKVFGELDHPSDGRTMLNRVSHIVTNLAIEDGKVIGEAEILDTDAGRNLQALMKAGCKVGVSSRGYGSTKPNKDGEDIVQEDYRLATFDFVADPADNTAYPEVFFEAKGKPMDLKSLTAESLKTENPALAESLATEAAAAKDTEWKQRFEIEKADAIQAEKLKLKEEFARNIMIAVAEAKASVTESVRAEMLADPRIAGAKKALDEVRAILQPYILPEEAAAHVATIEAKFTAENEALKLQVAELNLKVKDLEGLNTKLEGVAKEVGYNYFLERLLAGSSDSEMIRKMVGDVKAYSTSDEIKAKVEAIRAELARKNEQGETAVREARKKADENEAVAVETSKVYEAKLHKMELALENALKAQEQTSLQLYIERRLTNHPKASKIRSVIESVKPSSTDEIDGLIENFREPNRDPEVLEQVRSRIRQSTRGGREYRPLDEEAPSRKSARTEDYNGIGQSIEDLRALSGLHNKK